MRQRMRLAMIAAAIAATATAARAQLTSPQIGWQADLSTIAHDVSGTVTILDEDTLSISDFTYNGGGLSVYFYLGATNTQAAFESGLRIGPQLLGMPFGGTEAPWPIDLPAGETLEGYHGIAVWCVDVNQNFGSGTFVLPGDFNGNNAVENADLTLLLNNWAVTLPPVPAGWEGSPPTSPAIDNDELTTLLNHWGRPAGGGSIAVPEPATGLAGSFIAIVALAWRRARFCG